MRKPTGRPPGRPAKKIDAALMEFATPDQRAILEAVNSEGGTRGASKALGIKRHIILETVDAVTKRAAIRGYAP